MILFNHIWRSCITLLLLSGISANIYAQNVVFTAEAKSNKICLREKLQLQYIIKDAVSLRTITKPYDTDFIIVGGPYEMQNTSTSYVGAKAVQSSSISLTYMMLAKHEGIFVIPPVVARDSAGHIYQSNAVTIQVVSPPQNSSASR